MAVRSDLKLGEYSREDPKVADCEFGLERDLERLVLRRGSSLQGDLVRIRHLEALL